MSQVATVWVIGKGGCPILGLSSVERVNEAVASLEIQLTDAQIKHLEEPYKPTTVRGFKT